MDETGKASKGMAHQGSGLRHQLLSGLRARKGHFKLESGHHGDLWLDLELLCLRPADVRPLAEELARRLSEFEVEVVCGPLVDGAFVALMVATEINVEFTYAEPAKVLDEGSLFPVRYKVPPALRTEVAGKRVAIVNDVINAGSAVRGTFFDLKECGAEVGAIATLLVLGSAAGEFATQNTVSLVSLEEMPNRIWTPEECPLCEVEVPLETVS